MYRTYFFISVLFVSVLIAGIFLRGRLTNRDNYQQEFAERYRVYAVTVPTHLNFCGEKVPTSDFEVFERFDRELTINTYFQSQTILNIKRGSRYFPIIEPILKRNGIPDDFKYLCMVESGLSNATSPSNAVGFWQFIEETANRYGLKINEEVDERYDIAKSTEAACAYFKEAYSEFNNWTLTAASYNMGINGIRGALNKQKTNSFYDLYLNSETSRYIMRLLAIKEIYEHPKTYGYYIPQFLRYPPVPVYSETITETIEDLVEYAQAHKITYKTFKTLNPWLRKNELKNRSGQTYVIYFPQEGAEHLVSDFYGYDEQNDSTVIQTDVQEPIILRSDSNAASTIMAASKVQDSLVYVEINHIVERNEDLNGIAKKYHTTVPKIMIWNNLEFTTVQKGKLLRILVRKDLLPLIKVQERRR